MILLLNKAMQFDALSAGQLTPLRRKKVSKAPRKAYQGGQARHQGRPENPGSQAADARNSATSGSESADAVELLLAGLS
jgi:hypothetical protein